LAAAAEEEAARAKECPELPAELQCVISRSSMRYILIHHLGMEYRYTKKKGVLMNGAKRHTRIRKFMIEMNRALELEKTGDYVIVFTDESYIHQNHSRLTSWVKRGTREVEGGPSGKGKRLIILHAITRFGFITTNDAELVWGAGKQRASGMYFPTRDLATTRLHLRMGFYGGKDSQGATWGPVNIAGCWAKAEKEMNKWIAVDKDHVDGGLTGTITDLHGAENWTTSGDDCLDITDMECPPDPEPVDATALQVGPGDEENYSDDNESSAEEQEAGK